MKKIFITLFSLTFLLTLSQVSYIEKSMSIKLSNDEDFVVPVYTDSLFAYYHQKEDSIAELFVDRLDKSPLLSSLVDDSMFVCLSEVMYRNCDKAYNDKRLSPVLWSTGSVYNGLFNNCLHDLLKIKKVRDFAAVIVKDLLVELCKIYPQDFKNRYVKELTELLTFIKTIPVHKYRVVKESNYGYDQVLYVDGKKNESMSMDLRGFVLRRYLIDNIPLFDLEKYIKETLSAIQSVDVFSKSKVMYEARINNNNKYLITTEGNYYQIGRNKKIYPYNFDIWKHKRTLYGYNPLENGGSRIICRTNGKETIYTIETGNQKNGKWIPAVNSVWNGVLVGYTVVDSSGEIILTEYE